MIKNAIIVHCSMIAHGISYQLKSLTSPQTKSISLMNASFISEKKSKPIKPLAAFILMETLLTEVAASSGRSGLFGGREAVSLALDNLDTLSEADLAYLARYLATLTRLAVLAEDVAGLDNDLDKPNQLESAHGLVETLKRARTRENKEEITQILDQIKLSPVFTAHPTEMRRASILDRERAVQSALEAIIKRPKSLDKVDDGALNTELYRAIAYLWHTRLQRSSRITVNDEIGNLMQVGRTALLPALEALSHEAYNHGLKNWGGKLNLGSWIGGDRDGHPLVGDETLEDAIGQQMATIMDYYEDCLVRLERELTLSETLGPVTEALSNLAQSSPETSIHRADEPYRRAIARIKWRLRATKDRLSRLDSQAAGGYYDRPLDFHTDLKTISDSLSLLGGDRLIPPSLRSLMDNVETCGFHFMALDIRQNADVHERVIAELFRRSTHLIDYAACTENERVSLLMAELGHDRSLRWPFADYSDETKRELRIMDKLSRLVGLYGPGAISSYIVSKTASVSDLLEPLVLMKQAGLVLGGNRPRAMIKIAPLFETIEDLQKAPQIMEKWLSLSPLRAVLGEPAHQHVMLGYSDSNKDGGFVASRWSLYQASKAIKEVCTNARTHLTFFHGRGGSVGRGGGNSYNAIVAQPKGTVEGSLRVTEQGEMITRRFGTPELARQSLDECLGGVFTATLASKAAGSKGPEDETINAHFSILEDLSEQSLRAYRSLIYDDPEFLEFFTAITPISEIKDLNIGSRPAARTASGKIEDLRAIPWVFSWSQCRLMLPGWYGFASGVKALSLTTKDLKPLMGIELFDLLVTTMEIALAKADWEAALAYKALSNNQDAAQRIFARIKQEWDETEALILGLRGADHFMSTQPQLRQPQERLAPLLRDLNRLQVYLLGLRRGGNQHKLVQLATQLSINGLASGLRITG